MSISDPGSTATPGPGGLGDTGATGTNGHTSQQNDGGATQQAQQKAQEAAGQAKDQAQQAMGQAQDRARSVVDERSTQAGQQVSQQAGDLRTVGEKLREEGKEGPAKLADQAADRAEKLGSYLEQADADTILRDVEDFGRKQPWAVALGGVALGFAAARFLKASSPQRYDQWRTTGGQSQTGASAGQLPRPATTGAPRTGAATQPAPPMTTGLTPSDPGIATGTGTSGF